MSDLPKTVTDPAVEARVNALLDRLLAESREWRKKEIEPDWSIASDYYAGKHWPDRKPDAYIPRITYNQIHKIVIQTVALLTDIQPKAEVIPMTLSHSGDDHALWLEHSARMLNQTIKAIWQTQNVLDELSRCLVDMELYFKGFAKVVWDPLASGGLGDIRVIRVDPYTIYVDPFCLSLEDAQYLCFRTPRPLTYIRRRWPDKGFAVDADASLSTWRVDSPSSFMHKIGLRRVRTDETTQPSAIPKAWVEEFWIRDPTLNEDGTPKYPGGRVITRANGVVLQDVPNPFWDQKWPIVEIPAYPVNERFWETAPVNAYVDLQDVLNKFLSIIVSNAQQMGNTQWIGDRDALSPEEWDRLGNQPGGQIRIKPGRMLRREPPPVLPEWFLNVYTRAAADMQQLAGLMDPGAKVGGAMTPGGFVDSMVLALQAVIRMKARSLERAVQEIGQMMISRVIQFYGRERVLALEGVNGWETVRWDRSLIVPYSPDSGVPEEEVMKWAIRAYQYRVTPGSSLSLTREKQWAISAALFGMGAIDKQALLQDVEYPRREEVMRRMKLEEEAQQLRAQAAGGGRPPAGQRGPTSTSTQGRGRGANAAIIKGLMKNIVKG